MPSFAGYSMRTVLLLGICFWRKGREERNRAGFIGEKGGCGGKRGRRRRFGVAAGGVLEKNPAIRTMFDRSREPLARVSSLDERSFPVRLAKVFLAAVFSLIAEGPAFQLSSRTRMRPSSRETSTGCQVELWSKESGSAPGGWRS